MFQFRQETVSGWLENFPFTSKSWTKVALIYCGSDGNVLVVNHEKIIN